MDIFNNPRFKHCFTNNFGNDNNISYRTFNCYVIVKYDSWSNMKTLWQLVGTYSLYLKQTQLLEVKSGIHPIQHFLNIQSITQNKIHLLNDIKYRTSLRYHITFELKNWCKNSKRIELKLQSEIYLLISLKMILFWVKLVSIFLSAISIQSV